MFLNDLFRNVLRASLREQDGQSRGLIKVGNSEANVAEVSIATSKGKGERAMDHKVTHTHTHHTHTVRLCVWIW